MWHGKEKLPHHGNNKSSNTLDTNWWLFLRKIYKCDIVNIVYIVFGFCLAIAGAAFILLLLITIISKALAFR